MIIGVPEHVDDAEVRLLFAQRDGVPSVSDQIVAVSRLGAANLEIERPRPILVKFQTVEGRDAAFKFQTYMKPYRLDEDITPEQMQARKALGKEFHALRRERYSPFWRGVAIMLEVSSGLHPHVFGTTPPEPPCVILSSRVMMEAPFISDLEASTPTQQPILTTTALSEKQEMVPAASSPESHTNHDRRQTRTLFLGRFRVNITSTRPRGLVRKAAYCGMSFALKL